LSLPGSSGRVVVVVLSTLDVAAPVSSSPSSELQAPVKSTLATTAPARRRDAAAEVAVRSRRITPSVTPLPLAPCVATMLPKIRAYFQSPRRSSTLYAAMRGITEAEYLTSADILSRIATS